MIKIAICDEVVQVVNGMKRVIADHRYREEIQINTFTTGWELYESAARERYDIIFIDIERVPGKKDENGIQVSAKIKEMYPEVLIVFFSGKTGDESALLNLKPFRFMPKPIEEKELVNTVKDAIDRIKGWEDKYLDIKNKYFTYQINLDEILYFSSKWLYVELYSLYETFEFREKLDGVEERIRQKSPDFLRVNKSHLVNKRFIKRFSATSVIMTNDVCIPISRSRSDAVLKILKSENHVD